MLQIHDVFESTTFLSTNHSAQVVLPLQKVTAFTFVPRLRFELRNTAFKTVTVANYVNGAFGADDGTRTHKILVSDTNLYASSSTSACCPVGGTRTHIQLRRASKTRASYSSCATTGCVFASSIA